jgi:hypothetical protein
VYKSYADAPWYRRSGLMGKMTLLGIIFAPAIIFVCITVLTGDVYTIDPDGYGGLRKWSWWNKAAAIIILILQLAYTAAWLAGVLPSTSTVR